jgi:hypothetical protein
MASVLAVVLQCCLLVTVCDAELLKVRIRNSCYIIYPDSLVYNCLPFPIHYLPSAVHYTIILCTHFVDSRFPGPFSYAGKTHDQSSISGKGTILFSSTQRPHHLLDPPPLISNCIVIHLHLNDADSFSDCAA